MLPPIDPDSCDRDAADTYFALIFFDSPYVEVEYSISEPWLASGVRLSLEFIDPGESAQPLRAVDLSTARATASAPLARPALVSRTEWGCPDGQSSASWAPQYTDVSHLIVHHTATTNAASDWPAQVRSIWTSHTYTQDWGDIGYNYLIDPLGVIYEGRSGGDDVIGAHFSCQNANTMGVALLGEFGAAAPTLEAQASLERLLAWKAGQRGIDPLGASDHPGTELVLDNISGHRDANDSPTACTTTTICPGDQLYALLPEIRTAVAVAIPEPGASELAAVGAGVLGALGVRRRRGSAADRVRFSAFAWRPARKDTKVRRRRARQRRAPARRR
jgi:N-acetylmuramoyl-L-alanine amidase